MSKLSLDIESRSRVDLQSAGVYRYAEDLSTEILCVSWAFDDDEPEIWLPGEPLPFVLDVLDEIHAWNTGFERVMWMHILSKRHGWPMPFSTQWRCTAVKSAYANMPRGLAACSRAFGLKYDGKSAEGHKIMLNLCKPDKNGEWVEDAVMFKQLCEYCQQDVRAERAIGKLLPDWPQVEIDKYHVDCAFCDRGVPLDVSLCEGGIKVFETTKKKTAAAAVLLSGGEITAGTQRQRIKKFVNERGINIDNTQKETVDAILKTNDLDDASRTMLELLQSVAGSAASKYPSAYAKASADGRIRGGYMFYGAHTGRRSSPGLQLQNMKNCTDVEDSWIEAVRTGDADLVAAITSRSPAVALGDCVRGLVCAPEGKTFVFADLNQIEVRLARWLSGDEDGLDMFRAGLDPYIEYAKKFFEILEVSKSQRQFSKAPMLGGQYGMGPPRLRGYAKAFFVNMTAGESIRATKFYRDDNPKIVKFWHDVDDAVLICVQQKRPVTLRHVRFEMFKEWLEVHLPSGRSLFYRSPGFCPGKYGPVFSYERPAGYRESSWGGTFLENFCQGLTRDLLAPAELACYTNGWDMVIDQHDEIGSEVLEDHATEIRDKLLEVMCITPAWAKGLPIEAEAVIKKRFLK